MKAAAAAAIRVGATTTAAVAVDTIHATKATGEAATQVVATSRPQAVVVTAMVAVREAFAGLSVCPASCQEFLVANAVAANLNRFC